MKKLIKQCLAATYRVGVPFVLNRGEIAAILNARGLTGEGAEIGVKHGQFCEYTLDHWRGRLLYAVDPWREFSRAVYQDIDNVPDDEQEKNYQITARRLARFGERARILRMTSDEAARAIPDRSLDYVYLDARHDYESVREDIGLWYPKLRPGALFAGHDYFNGEIGGTAFGVKRAVDEFAAARGLRVRATRREPQYKSWIILVPA